MADGQNHGVVGTDNEVPIYNPNGLWQMWSIDQIFRGGPGLNKYVPKRDDYVRVPKTYVTYIVDYLDPITLVPTLRRINPDGYEQVFSETDILFGTGRHPMETYRVYIDKSVYPHELVVDQAATVAGTACRYVKLKRLFENGTEQVVSRMYDNNGNFVSENVPLEVAAVTNVQINHSIRVPQPCKTVEDLKSGDFLFVDAYTEAGVLASRRQVVVEESSFLRALNASTKYITGITLESPFLSETEVRTIKFPLNLNLGSINFFGVVHYSDGSSLRLPVDGTKFELFGLDQFVSTIPGQKIELLLKYNFSTGETGLSNVSTNGHSMSEYYDLIVDNANNSYAVKLFGYPVWQSLASGYRMEWWLYNLDRNIAYNVSDKVRFENSHGAFNPLNYGVVQQKMVSLNLRDVTTAFKNFIHTQRVNITLMGPPQDTDPAWTMLNETKSNMVEYGHFAFATKTGLQTLNIRADQTTYENWLEEVYYKTYPLLNRAGQEIKPPAPTHFRVSYGNDSLLLPVSDWNAEFTMSTETVLYRSVKVQFVKRTSTQDLELGVAYFTIR